MSGPEGTSTISRPRFDVRLVEDKVLLPLFTSSAEHDSDAAELESESLEPDESELELELEVEFVLSLRERERGLPDFRREEPDSLLAE